MKTFTIPYPVVRIGHCFGNESKLEDCVAFTDPNRVPCSNNSLGIVVNCSTGKLVILNLDNYFVTHTYHVQ